MKLDLAELEKVVAIGTKAAQQGASAPAHTDDCLINAGSINKAPVFGNDYIRKKITTIGRLMFDRQLTDAGGGNVSVRHNGVIYITPQQTGEIKRWQLEPDDLIAMNADTYEVIENDGDTMTRESLMHIGLYKAMPEIGAVIHAHPRYCLVYACAEKQMPVYTESFAFFNGERPMDCVKRLPGTSPEMAAEVISYIFSYRDALKAGAVGVFLPDHGIVIAGPTLDDCFVLLDNAEVNAMVGLFSKLL